MLVWGNAKPFAAASSIPAFNMSMPPARCSRISAFTLTPSRPSILVRFPEGMMVRCAMERLPGAYRSVLGSHVCAMLGSLRFFTSFSQRIQNFCLHSFLQVGCCCCYSWFLCLCVLQLEHFNAYRPTVLATLSCRSDRSRLVLRCRV